MPHASGGGSHGGGSYHSSGSSGYRSSGGSHGGGRSSYSGSSSHGSYSGGSGSYGTRVSRTYFPGSRLMVYNGAFGRERTIYCSGSGSKPSRGMTIGAIIFVSVIALPILWFVAKIAFYVPRAVDLASYDSVIVIEDQPELLDEEALADAFGELQRRSGVTAGLELVLDSAWEPYYDDLETYAYSEYLRLYDDEKHWLVVVSYPDDYAQSEFIDWSWIGMAGDEIGSCVNSEAEDLFSDLIHKQLLRSTPETLSVCLENAFREFAASVMEMRIRTGGVITEVIFVAIYGFVVFVLLRDYLNEKHVYEARPVSQAKKEPVKKTCAYCGSGLAANAEGTCPCCGAPIR